MAESERPPTPAEPEQKKAPETVPDSTVVGLGDLLSWLYSKLGPLKNVKAKTITQVVSLLGVSSIGAAFALVDVQRARFLLTLALLSGVEVLLLVGAIWLIAHVQTDVHEVSSPKTIEQKAASQFRFMLGLVIVTWIIQYLLIGGHDAAMYLACRAETDAAKVPGCVREHIPLLGLCGDMANYLTSLAFLTVYVVLARRTAAPGDSPTMRTLLGAVAGLIGIALSIVAFVAGHHGINLDHVAWQPPAPTRLLPDLDTASDVYNGLYGGMTMALVFGRLESKYIGLRGSLAGLLFLYALIQPVYDHLATGGYMRMALLLTALLLKMLFLVICAWSLDEGRMAFYMGQVRYIQVHIGDMLKRYKTDWMITRAPIRGTVRKEAEEFVVGGSAVKVSLSLRNVDIAEWLVLGFECERAVIGDAFTALALDPKVVGRELPIRLTNNHVDLDLLIALQADEQKLKLASTSGTLTLPGLRLKVARTERGREAKVFLRDLTDADLKWKAPPALPELTRIGPSSQSARPPADNRAASPRLVNRPRSVRYPSAPLHSTAGGGAGVVERRWPRKVRMLYGVKLWMRRGRLSMTNVVHVRAD